MSLLLDEDSFVEYDMFMEHNCTDFGMENEKVCLVVKPEILFQNAAKFQMGLLEGINGLATRRIRNLFIMLESVWPSG